MDSLPRIRGMALHVFQENGGWHWGLTTERRSGTGDRVVAFNDQPFESEAQARIDGERVRDTLHIS